MLTRMDAIQLGTTLAWAFPIILAVIAMPLISIINGLAGWSATYKKLTVVGVSLVLGVLYVIASDMIQELPDSWAPATTRVLVVTATVIVVTQAVYKMIQGPLTALETFASRGNKGVSEDESSA